MPEPEQDPLLRHPPLVRVALLLPRPLRRRLRRPRLSRARAPARSRRARGARRPCPPPEPARARAALRAADAAPALQLLALFQREGRLVDFLQQDIASFPDADVGAAARVVHEGCRKALRAHAEIAPVRAEEEGARVTLEAGFDPTR